MTDEVVGRSADGVALVVRERTARRARDLVQTVFVYRTMAAGRDADPRGGELLGRTGDPGLRAALARVLGERGAAAVLADEARELLRRLAGRGQASGSAEASRARRSPSSSARTRPGTSPGSWIEASA